MSLTEKRIQEDDFGSMKRPNNNKRRDKSFRLIGLLLAGLVLFGTMQQEVHAEEPGSAELAAGKAVEQMASGLQKIFSQIMKEADAAKEAEEKARSYDFTLGFAGDICLADNYIPMQHLQAIGSEDISDGIDPRFIEIMKGMD